MICDLQQVSINQKNVPQAFEFCMFSGRAEWSIPHIGRGISEEKAEQLRGDDRDINKRRLSIV